MQWKSHLIFFAVAASVITAPSDNQSSCELDFCEVDPNYPEQILNTLPLWQYKFNSPVEVPKAKRSASSDSFLVETKLCDSKISFSRPQRMKSADNKTRTIVNHLNFTQLVRFEYCSSENFPCTYNIYPKTIQSHCQQKYMLVKLVAFDDDNSCLVTEKFLVPSSCDCMIATGDFIKGVKEDLLRLP